MHAATEGRVVGTVKANGIRRDKGFCFVTVAGLDYFVHKTAVGRFHSGRFEQHLPTWTALAEGQQVELVIADGAKGPRGEQLTVAH